MHVGHQRLWHLRDPGLHSAHRRGPGGRHLRYAAYGRVYRISPAANGFFHTVLAGGTPAWPVDGYATSAAFNFGNVDVPVAFDALGRLHVLDTYSVRRVTIRSDPAEQAAGRWALVETVAGTPSVYGRQQDGQGTAALLALWNSVGRAAGRGRRPPALLRARAASRTDLPSAARPPRRVLSRPRPPPRMMPSRPPPVTPALRRMAVDVYGNVFITDRPVVRMLNASGYLRTVAGAYIDPNWVQQDGAWPVFNSTQSAMRIAANPLTGGLFLTDSSCVIHALGWQGAPSPPPPAPALYPTAPPFPAPMAAGGAGVLATFAYAGLGGSVCQPPTDSADPLTATFDASSSAASIAYSPVTRALYVVESANTCVRAVDTASGAVSTLAGVCGTSGYLDGPANSALFGYLRNPTVDGAGSVVRRRRARRQGTAGPADGRGDPRTPTWL